MLSSAPGKKRALQLLLVKDAEAGRGEREMWVEEKGEYYKTRFKETEWNGIPAYIKFVRDVTQEVEMRKEKERLEQYFQTLVRHLPGGVAVVRYERTAR